MRLTHAFFALLLAAVLIPAAASAEASKDDSPCLASLRALIADYAGKHSSTPDTPVLEYTAPNAVRSPDACSLLAHSLRLLSQMDEEARWAETAGAHDTATVLRSLMTPSFPMIFLDVDPSVYSGRCGLPSPPEASADWSWGNGALIPGPPLGGCAAILQGAPSPRLQKLLPAEMGEFPSMMLSMRSLAGSLSDWDPTPGNRDGWLLLKTGLAETQVLGSKLIVLKHLALTAKKPAEKRASEQIYWATEAALGRLREFFGSFCAGGSPKESCRMALLAGSTVHSLLLCKQCTLDSSRPRPRR